MLKTHPLHEKALLLVKTYLATECELIECLQAIDKERVFEKLGHTSLFKYAVDALRLSESQAYTLIGVARKCEKVPGLKSAIESGQLSASKARKIVSVITPENSDQWIQKAIELPQRELERTVAAVSPVQSIPERVRPVGVDRAELRIGISDGLEKKLRRAQEIIASRSREICSIEKALDTALESFLEKHDPLRVAGRGAVRLSRGKLLTAAEQMRQDNQDLLFLRTVVPNEEGGSLQDRKKLPENLRRQVLFRDHGQCQAKKPNGDRCDSRNWVEVHHRVPVCEGGHHDMTNLITLCRAHHAMTHDHWGRLAFAGSSNE